jgi:hypothetical protein
VTTRPDREVVTKNTILAPLLILLGSSALTPALDPATLAAEAGAPTPEAEPPAELDATDVPAPEVPAPEVPAPEVSVDEPPLTPDQHELVDWARGRFDAAGLELPPVTVRFDSTRELCKMQFGLFEQDEFGYRITICTFDGDTFGAELARRRTLLHEFAHVWDAENLTDADRDVLIDRFGVDAWIDGADDWDERGIEHFAETFVFGLLDQPRRSLEIEVECPEVAATFESITGVAPLGPGLPWCVEAQSA